MLRKRWLGKISEGANEDEDEDEDEYGDADEPRHTQNTAIDAVYKPWVKERLCWEILASTAVPYLVTGAEIAKETIERIYREGTRFVSILDPETIKKFEKARGLSFIKRIAKLV